MKKDVSGEKKMMGSRLKQFRELVGKAQYEIAEDLNISQSTVANIERGNAYPNIKYLCHFFNNHRLNINWLLTGIGEMVIEETGADMRYRELMKLMQVPAIENVVMGKFAEVKTLFRDEIDAFWAEQDENRDSEL